MSAQFLFYPFKGSDSIAELYIFDPRKKLKLPMYLSSVSAGLPSTTDDHIEERMDLNEFLIKHPTSTFFIKVSGDSMIGAGIHHNDTLIVDRAEEITDKKIIVAAIDGELTVKRLKRDKKGEIWLLPENPDYQPIEIKEEMDFQIWGVVTSVIHNF